MRGTIVKRRRKCCGLGRSDSLGSAEKFFSSFDSELRFLVYSLHSFINEFMEVRVGGRVHELQGQGIRGRANPCTKTGNTGRAGGGGMKHIGEGQRHEEGAAEVRLVLCSTDSIPLTLG